MSKIEALRQHLMRLYYEHEADGMIPTSARFLFYELIQAEIIPKHASGVLKPGARGQRRPDQDMSDALTSLRESGQIPWEAIVDETRSLDDFTGWPSIAEGADAYLVAARWCHTAIWTDCTEAPSRRAAAAHESPSARSARTACTSVTFNRAAMTQARLQYIGPAAAISLRRARAVERSMWRERLACERERAEHAEGECARLLTVVDGLEIRLAAAEARADAADVRALAAESGRVAAEARADAERTKADVLDQAVAGESARADALKERAEVAEAELATERGRTDALRGRIDELKGLLGSVLRAQKIEA